MSTIGQLQARIKAVNVQTLSQASIEETKNVIIEKQVDQLRHGLDSSGGLIGDRKPYRNPLYASYKAGKNPLPGFGNPDLIDTGSFVSKIKVDVGPDVYKTDSEDFKSADLQAKYGKEILSLDKKNKADYVNEALRPALVKKIKEITQL